MLILKEFDRSIKPLQQEISPPEKNGPGVANIPGNMPPFGNHKPNPNFLRGTKFSRKYGLRNFKGGGGLYF